MMTRTMAQTIMTSDHHEVAARCAQGLSDNAPMPIINSVMDRANSNTEMNTPAACMVGENLNCAAGPETRLTPASWMKPAMVPKPEHNENRPPMTIASTASTAMLPGFDGVGTAWKFP